MKTKINELYATQVNETVFYNLLEDDGTIMEVASSEELELADEDFLTNHPIIESHDDFRGAKVFVGPSGKVFKGFDKDTKEWEMFSSYEECYDNCLAVGEGSLFD